MEKGNKKEKKRVFKEEKEEVAQMLFNYRKFIKLPGLYGDDEEMRKEAENVSAAIKLLDKEAQLVIYNDFVEKVNEKQWWKDVYSRSTYYRIKGRGMKTLKALLKR